MGWRKHVPKWVEVKVMPKNSDAEDEEHWDLWDTEDLETLWLAGRPNSLRGQHKGSTQNLAFLNDMAGFAH